MSGFFGRLKSGTAPTSPATGTTPVKKHHNAPEPTLLEKLLLNAGPLRGDGSDKFFGFENFGSTCYCNSIVQCLFYSVPFREQVINFPARSSPEALERPLLPPINTNVHNGQTTPCALTARGSISSPSAKMPAKPISTPTSPLQPLATRPEDNKDSPEYKKKQALATGPVLQMDYENANSYGMNESLFSSLKDIFEAVIAHRSRTGIVSPHKLLEILRRDNEMFRTPMHQDAHEFFNLLLNEVVENVEQYSMSRVKEVDEVHQNGTVDASTTNTPAVSAAVPTRSNSRWVHELFEGTLTSETRCLTCENTSQRDEAFLDLSVDLDQHSSVTSCLRKFSEEEMLCERNKFHCDNCGGLQEAEKRMKIKRLPKILALHLKRFKYTEDLQRLQKLFHRVVYPFYLRLFNTTDDAKDPDRLYELYAVVVHIGGGPYHGHYVSIIKTKNRGWLLFDDEMVEPVDKAYVRSFFGGENTLACAYVLFYQETTEEAMMKEQEAEGLAAAKQATEIFEEVPHVVSPKVNGMANGHLHHSFHSPKTPTVEEEDHFASLDHAATAPALAKSPIIPEHPPIEYVNTQLPTLSTKKSIARFKKENKEEKEAKAAAKEAKKQAEQKKRDETTLQRENFRKQEQESEVMLAASKITAEEEGHLRRTGSEKRGDSAHTDSGDSRPHTNGMGGVKGMSGLNSGLGRFRQTSISFKGKSKFWNHKEKHRDKDRDRDIHSSNEDITNRVVLVPHIPSDAGHSQSPLTDERPSKSRFSLGKKKGNFKF